MLITAICNLAGSAMPKNRQIQWLLHRNKFLRVMQLTAVFMLVLSLTVSATVKSQKITFSAKNVAFEKVFTEIEKQTSYVVIASQDIIDRREEVTIEAFQMELKQFLEIIFKNKPFDFEIKEKTIFVKEKTAGITDQLGNQLSVFPPINVKGKVLNEKGEPVIASIIVKGTKNGVKTDDYGNFSIANVDDKATLVISGIGIETQEIKIAGRTEIIIAVNSKIAEEEEVIFNGGYYKTTEKLRTGNISKVTSKEIGNQPVTNPLMALQGRVPGLEITPTNGTPGGAPVVRVRGNNSLRGAGNRYFADNPGNYPLYVVDGVPINSSPIASVSPSLMQYGSDPLGFLNPQNIESIEILKDGDATAIYGSRGANGVILITTKQGKTAGKTNFDFNVYRGGGRMLKKIEFLNTTQYLEMRHEAFANDGRTPSSDLNDVNNYAPDILLWDTSRYTDWQDVFLGGTATITDVNTSISGGNASTSFVFGGGYHRETLILPGDSWYGSGTIHASLNHIAKNRKFRTGFSFNYGTTQNKLSGGFNGFGLPPNAPKLFDDQGKLNWEIGPSGIESWFNPLANLAKQSTSKSSSLAMNSYLGYEVVTGLTIKVNFGLTELQGNEIYKDPITARAPSTINSSARGSSLFGNNYRRSWIIEPQANYFKKIGEHSLSTVLGGTLQESNAIFQNIQAGGYTSDDFLESLQAATTITYFTDDNNRYRYTSLFTRIGYNYHERYIFNLTGRRDGSSRFGPGNKFGNFGSIGAAWIFSEEPFIKRILKFLDFGKLRGSYGITGSDQIGDYKFYNLYNVGIPYNNVTALYPDALYNSDFAWEITKKSELGIQLGFLRNKISVELNWYFNRSSNQLVDYTLPMTTGFPSILSNFDATIENTGLEALINTTNISSSHFKWTTSFNISIPKNKLAKFDGIENSPYALEYKIGQPLSIQRLYTWTGVNPQTGEHKFLDLNKDGVYNDADKSFMYPLDQQYYGGLNNSLQYGNIECSFLFQFSSRFASQLKIANVIGSAANQPANVLSRWKKPGDITTVQKFTQEYFSSYAVMLNSSDYLMQDASYIRLKTLSLSYNLPKRITGCLKMQTAKIYIQGQNLVTITQLKNLDPETESLLPPLTMLTIGLQAKF